MVKRGRDESLVMILTMGMNITTKSILSNENVCGKLINRHLLRKASAEILKAEKKFFTLYWLRFDKTSLHILDCFFVVFVDFGNDSSTGSTIG